MRLTGFTDEAGQTLETQIRATQALGWKQLSARSIDGQNIHDLSEADFNAAADQLDEAGISVIEFGSLIGSWSKPIESDFAITLGEIERAIPRMQRLGTKLIRVMSYAQKPWGENQHEAERFRRLREIVTRFADAGLQAVHENCMNWGGFSAAHTLRLIEEVPGLKLVFDTGNPVFQRDRSKSAPYPWQDPLDFYHAVKAHIAHVHIKDCLHPPKGCVEPERYTLPGQGHARLPEILAALQADGYDAAYAIEPHVATVFHANANETLPETLRYLSYVEYGQAFEQQLANTRKLLLRAPLKTCFFCTGHPLAKSNYRRSHSHQSPSSNRAALVWTTTARSATTNRQSTQQDAECIRRRTKPSINVTIFVNLWKI